MNAGGGRRAVNGQSVREGRNVYAPVCDCRCCKLCGGTEGVAGFAGLVLEPGISLNMTRIFRSCLPTLLSSSEITISAHRKAAYDLLTLEFLGVI